MEKKATIVVDMLNDFVPDSLAGNRGIRDTQGSEICWEILSSRKSTNKVINLIIKVIL